MLRVLAAASLLALLVVPMPASAAWYPPCEWVTEQVDAPVYLVAVAGGREIWQETNGVAGLQRQTCMSDGSETAPDTRVAFVPIVSVPRCPIDLGGTLVCIA